MTIAHVFWHGEMTRYERASMHSLVLSGFDVWFWSLVDYDLPGEIKKMNASTVVPRELVLAYTHEHWNEDWGQATDSTSITFYSDILRYRLLELYGGWWFDLDTICLRKAEDFEALASTRDICIGWQDVSIGLCNNAILSIPNSSVAMEINRRVSNLIESKKTFFWGEIGPALLSEYLAEANLLDQLLPRVTFYPNSIEPNVQNMWQDGQDISTSERLDLDAELQDAYVLHWYNNNLIPSDKRSNLPIPSSFMGELFKTIGFTDADI